MTYTTARYVDGRGYPRDWDDVVATPEQLADECGGARDDEGEPRVEPSGQIAMDWR